MFNPVADYRNMYIQYSKPLIDNYNKITRGIVPETFDFRYNQELPQVIPGPNGEQILIRDIYIKECGFTLIAEDWIKPLAKWIGNRPCLEVMAGSGWLTYALKKYGARVVATDNYSWRDKFSILATNVENLDCLDAVRKYGSKVSFIICSWPYMDDTAYKLLLEMRRINPRCRMIYIGEWVGGCTADDNFFMAAQECEVKGFDDAVIAYKQWAGIHDRVYLIK